MNRYPPILCTSNRYLKPQGHWDSQHQMWQVRDTRFFLRTILNWFNLNRFQISTLQTAPSKDISQHRSCLFIVVPCRPHAVFVTCIEHEQETLATIGCVVSLCDGTWRKPQALTTNGVSHRSQWRERTLDFHNRRHCENRLSDRWSDSWGDSNWV